MGATRRISRDLDFFSHCDAADRELCLEVGHEPSDLVVCQQNLQNAELSSLGAAVVGAAVALKLDSDFWMEIRALRCGHLVEAGDQHLVGGRIETKRIVVLLTL